MLSAADPASICNNSFICSSFRESQDCCGCFTRPSFMILTIQLGPGVCQHMLGWARRASQHLEGDLLELYCGNGNFTVALADRFRYLCPGLLIANDVELTSRRSGSTNNAKQRQGILGLLGLVVLLAFCCPCNQPVRFNRKQGRPQREHAWRSLIMDSPSPAGRDDMQSNKGPQPSVSLIGSTMLAGHSRVGSS